jgi:hypothetical protein
MTAKSDLGKPSRNTVHPASDLGQLSRAAVVTRCVSNLTHFLDFTRFSKTSIREKKDYCAKSMKISAV